MGTKKHRFLRRLYHLQQKLTETLFIKTIKRALQYRITEIETLERMAFLLLQEGNYPLPDVTTNDELYHRDAYLEGRFTDEPDLIHYDKLTQDDNDE